VGRRRPLHVRPAEAGSYFGVVAGAGGGAGVPLTTELEPPRPMIERIIAVSMNSTARIAVAFDSTVAPERAGMASGISTTSRFCGILLGFAGIGAVLASGTRAALLAGASQAGATIAPDLVERVIAGDTGALPAGLAGLLRRSVEAGFAHGFLAAGMAAVLASAVVMRCMHTPTAR